MVFGRESVEIPVLDEPQSNGREWTKYGRDNKYPEELFGIYNSTPLMKAIVSSIVDYVCGAMDTQYTHINTNGDEIEDILRKCVKDYCIYGGFALIVNKLQGSNIVEYISFKNLRTNASHSHFWYNPRWGKMSADPIEYPRWTSNTDAPHSILYVCGDNVPADRAYPIPTYSGAITDLKTSCEISNFHLASILNNFSASAIVNFNNGMPDEEQQRKIEDMLEAKFCGSGKAAKMLVTFNDSKEQAVTVERLAEDNFDQKYTALKESIHENIYTAFRINPILIGLNVATGFSKQEFSEAYDLFYTTVIIGLQSMFSRALKKVGIDIEFGKLDIYSDTVVSEEGVEQEETEE